MPFIRRLHVIDSHTAGEPTRLVTDGFPELEGHTLREMEADLLANHADLAKMLVGEPRGHAPWHAVLPLPALHPEADLSILILSALGSLTMCGHALIGTITSLVEIFRIESVETVTKVVVETLSGLVVAEARVEGTKVRSVTLQGVPSRVALTELEVEVDGRAFEMDLAFGGLWFALVRVEQTGMPISVESVPDLVALSHRIRLELNRILGERTDLPPGTPERVDHLLYVGPPRSPGSDGQNLATSTGLGFDRSPCGTGSCARMAWHLREGGTRSRGHLRPRERPQHHVHRHSQGRDTDLGAKGDHPHHHRLGLSDRLQPARARQPRPSGRRVFHPSRRR